MAVRFAVQMSGQMSGLPAAIRVMSRKPPAARRSSARCSSARSVGEAHERGRGEVRDVRHHGHQRVVLRGVEGEDLGAQRAHHGADGLEGLVGRVGDGGEHPHGALEQVVAGPLDAELLGAGHRVPADEPRVADRVGTTDSFTLPTSVTTPPVAARASRATVATGCTGVATKVISASGSTPTSSITPSARARSAAAASASVPDDVPAPGAQRRADRAADEAGADHGGATGCGGGHGSSTDRCTLRRGGRRAATGRLRGTRGAARRGCARWRGARAPGCTAAWHPRCRAPGRRAAARRPARTCGRRWPGTGCGCRRWP